MKNVTAMILSLILIAGLSAWADAVPVRVMPLGDSLTLGAYAAGQNGTGGYRAPLWNRLVAAQYDVDFVGSVNGPAPAGVAPNHEGHGGWRIDDITGKIDGWLATSQPDVILLIIGANDIIQGASVDTAQKRMNTLLDRIFTDRPGVKLLVGNLIWVPQPNQYKYDLAKIKDFNRRLPAMIAARAAQGRNIALVDMCGQGDLTAADFGSDGVHPNDKGYAKMANVWYGALGARLAAPIALNASNNHYFLFRGRPTVLITSAEHYGAVLNLDFDYVKYLDALARDGLNLTRTFSGTYVEDSAAFNIVSNTLAPAPGRFICPWARSDTPGYANGGNKFDLARLDEDYFKRLRDFVGQAGKRGIVIEVNLFCPAYGDQWRLSPLNIANNINGLGGISHANVYSLNKHGGLLAVQERMVRKFVEELRGFDNVYYEICNEPYFGGATLEWQRRIADVIADAQKDHPNKKLIAQNIANKTAKVSDPHPAVSILNFHYTYPPVVVAENFALNRLIGENETGGRGTRDEVYRVEAWDFIVAGGGLFNHLDYSFTVGHEDGTFQYPPTQPGGGSVAFRRQLRVLREFINRFDFVKMKPADKLVRAGRSDDVSVRVLAEPGRQYAIYLHNSPMPRWKDRAKLNTGDFQVNLELDAPAATYRAEWIEPATGKVLLAETKQHTGGALALPSPRYTQDVALRLTAVSRPRTSAASAADPAFPLKVSENRRHLVDQQGTPFLYQADTPWMLFTKPTETEAKEYIARRKEQGFTALQVMLTGFLGMTNRAGELPFGGTPPEQDFASPARRPHSPLQPPRSGFAPPQSARLLRQIVLLRVFLHHPAGVELRDDGGEGPADFLDPPAGNALLIALEVAGDDLLREHFVEVGAVEAVLFLHVVHVGVFADGEAVGAVVGLAPPTVEDAEVEAPVAGGLHPAGARGLQRPPRRVEPHVAARGHRPCHMHVVVLDEDQVALQLAVLAEVDDVLDVTFAGIVARVGLAREDELDGPLPVARELHDVFKLLEDQRRPLVRGKAPRKADGQRVGIEERVESDEVAARQALVLQKQAAAGELDHLAPQPVAQAPNLLVGEKGGVGQLPPEIRFAEQPFPGIRGLAANESEEIAQDRGGLLFLGAAVEFAAPESAHRPFEPAQRVDAVGDVADGHLVRRAVGIQAMPHAPADAAVQLTDGVGCARILERQHCHAKRLRVVPGIDAPQPQNLLPRRRQSRPEPVQRVIHQARREPVVARLHRRVGGEDAFGPGLRQRLEETFSGGHFLPQQLQGQECRVAFVHVEDRRLDPHRAQQPHPADAQEDFLHDAGGTVAAVHVQRQVSEGLLVVRQIGVEQVHRHAPDGHAPGGELDAAHGDLHLACHRLAGGVEDRLDGQVGRIQAVEVFGLPVVRVHGLHEVAFTVKQAHAHQAYVEVAGGLRVIAGQDAQAARGDGQGFMEAELGGEVGHRSFQQRRRPFAAPGVALRPVGIKGLHHLAHAVGEETILEPHAQLVIRNLAQDGHGVVVEIRPPPGRKFRKNLLRLLIPRPPQVGRHPV